MLRFPKFCFGIVQQNCQLLSYFQKLAQNVSTFVKRYITAFTTRISFKDSSTKYLLRWGVDFRQVSSDILAPFSKPAHGWLGRIVNFWQEPHHIGWAKVALVLEEKRWKSCCWCFRSCHRSCFLIFRFVLREHFWKKLLPPLLNFFFCLSLSSQKPQISKCTSFSWCKPKSFALSRQVAKHICF